MVITQSAYEDAARKLEKFAKEIDVKVLSGNVNGNDKITLIHLQATCRSFASSMVTAATGAALDACDEDNKALQDIINTLGAASQKLLDTQKTLEVASAVVKLASAIVISDSTAILDDLTALQAI
jgi:Tfp pilus assembly major pilin PilA